MSETADAKGAAWKPGAFRLAVATAGTRLTGFFREVVLAAVFGAGAAMDAFVVAFSLCNLLRRLLGEQAAENCLVPVFRPLHTGGEKEAAWRVWLTSLVLAALVLLVFVAVCLVAAPWMVRLMAPGFSATQAAATATTARLMAPFALLIGTAAGSGAILLSLRKMLVYGLAPMAINLGLIAAAVWLGTSWGVPALGLGAVVGALVMLLICAVPVLRALRADRVTPRIDLQDAGVRRVGRLLGPIVPTAILGTLAPVVDRFFASGLAEGSISALWYAVRLIQLPIAVFGLAVARSVFSALSTHQARDDRSGFRAVVWSGLKWNLLVLVPVGLAMILWARPLLQLIYSRGRFGPDALNLTVPALQYYALGLFAWGACALLSRAFYVQLDARTPLFAAILGFVLNVVLDAILIRTPLAHAGVALATTVAFTVQALVLFICLSRRSARH